MVNFEGETPQKLTFTIKVVSKVRDIWLAFEEVVSALDKDTPGAKDAKLAT